MTVDVRSKVHRVLRALPSFRACERWADAAHLASLRVPLRSEESLLGYYENQPGSVEEVILVTDQGLYVRDAQAWSSTRYEDIAGAKWLGARKTDATGIELLLESGETLTVPVRGGDDRFRDAFEVLRFIDRVAFGSGRTRRGTW